MSGLANTKIATMREAAAAWRRRYLVGRARFSWLFPDFGGPPSLYDRVDELIDEIERLRRLANRPPEPASAGKAAP